MIIEKDGKKYKNCFQTIIWSGGINGTFRKLEFEMEINDEFKIGDKISFKLQNTKELFRGRIFSIEKTVSSLVMNVTAIDDGIYLNKNRFVKNYFNKMPSSIVDEICKELKLEVGRVPQDKVKCMFPAIDCSGYEIIMKAYTIQHNKDKKTYSVACNNGKIEILDENIMLETELNSSSNIRDATYRTDIERMINQIVIYKVDGEKGQIIGKVANEEDKNKYGLFQDVMQYNQDVNNIVNAQDMLEKLNERATIVVDGNVDLQAGYTVAVKEEKTGLYGIFLIVEDTHTWKNGNYETRLELSFEIAMDKIELKNEKGKREIKESKYELTDPGLKKEYEAIK